ncbi:hypothetical protein STANM309S_03724 [Streptomyces tanashiensis]
MLAETICAAVSAAGLGIAAISAYRKKFLSAARTAAYALVPLGLVMTGAVEWIADTAFSPVAWAASACSGSPGCSSCPPGPWSGAAPAAR